MIQTSRLVTDRHMPALLRALLLRNRYCAPAGADGESPGGAADEVEDAPGAADDSQDDAGEAGRDDEADQADEGEEPAEGAETEAETEAEADDDLVITLEGQGLADDEEDMPAGASPKASAAFAKMRAEKKRLERENRELKARQEEIAARAQQAQPIEPLGEEPTLESCDFDAETYAAKLKTYLGKKAEHDARKAEAEAQQRKQQEQWQQRLDAYKQEAAKLKRDDFEDAESAVKSAFNTVQQSLLLKHPKAAALVYVLGKNPARARQLAAISDPVDFAYAAADLAGQVKVERKSPPPPTDAPVRGRTNGAAIASQTIDSLREQARRTGDYSAYLKAKRAAETRREKAAA